MTSFYLFLPSLVLLFAPVAWALQNPQFKPLHGVETVSRFRVKTIKFPHEIPLLRPPGVRRVAQSLDSNEALELVLAKNYRPIKGSRGRIGDRDLQLKRITGRIHEPEMQPRQLEWRHFLILVADGQEYLVTDAFEPFHPSSRDSQYYWGSRNREFLATILVSDIERDRVLVRTQTYGGAKAYYYQVKL